MTPKPLKERIREILKECFNCRTSTQEYHLEFEKALQAILTEIKENLPAKKELSTPLNICNTWNAYHDEMEKLLDGAV